MECIVPSKLVLFVHVALVHIQSAEEGTDAQNAADQKSNYGAHYEILLCRRGIILT